MVLKRRLFLFAAPAIVAAPSLMKVSALHTVRATVIFNRIPKYMPGAIHWQFVALAEYEERYAAEVTGITDYMRGIEWS